VGALLIVGSFFVIDENTTFPGLMSLPPTIGTALLLLSSPPRLVSRFLTWVPLKHIGLASYSIYLIHWPLIAFTQRATLAPDLFGYRAILFIASIIIGYLSYRVIESPFRQTFNIAYRPRVFTIIALIGMTLTASVASLIINERGYPNRFPNALDMTWERVVEQRDKYWQNFGSNKESQLEIDGSFGYVLVIGNSHAQDLVYALRQNAFAGNIKYIGTPFYCFNFGVGTDSVDDQRCNVTRKQLLSSELLQGASKIYLHEDFNGEWIKDLLAFFESLRSTTEAPIFLFGPRLTFKRSVLQIAHEHGSINGLTQYALTQSFLPERKKLTQKLEQAFKEARLSEVGIFYLDMLRIQCGEHYDHCAIVSPQGSEFLYFDNSHFTTLGARNFGALLKARRPDIFELK
jgi:hypothetical protein